MLLARKRVAWIIALLTAITVVAGCGPRGPQAVPETYTGENDFIVIEGLEQGERKITVAELMTLSSVSEEVVATDDDGKITEQYTAEGVLLETVLSHLGIASKDLDTVRFTAGDSYSVEVPNSILTSRKLILAYKANGKFLPAGDGPIRVFIPEERSMYWVRNTLKISLSWGNAGDEVGVGSVKRIIFFETLLAELESVDYPAETGAKAVKTAAVLADVQASPLVRLLAADGFVKNEELATFKELYIVTEGEDTPALRGPELPLGMHVKYLVALWTGDSGFAFVERGLDYFTPTEAAGFTGVSLQELTALFGLTSETYVLTASDGYSVEVGRDDLAAGIVYMQENGELASAFEGLPKNTGVRNLLSIAIGE